MGSYYIHYSQKDGSVRWVSNFRELNEAINRNINSLSLIQAAKATILTQRAVYYALFTKLYFSMQYYTFAINLECQHHLGYTY